MINIVNKRKIFEKKQKNLLITYKKRHIIIVEKERKTAEQAERNNRNGAKDYTASVRAQQAQL